METFKIGYWNLLSIFSIPNIDLWYIWEKIILGLSDLTPIWEFHTTLFKLFEPFTLGKRVKKYCGSYRQITGYNFETRVVKHDSVFYIQEKKSVRSYV